MRQAGRYLPEYRELRKKHDFLTICKTPDLILKVTLFPLSRLDVDAAIIFSDIIFPLKDMGIQVDIKDGVGPQIENPIRSMKDIDEIGSFEPDANVPRLLDAIKMITREIDVPLIGFSGAPFTLASYLIEGGPSKNFAHTKQLMYNDADAWHKLMDKLSSMVLEYLKLQIHAGVDAVQLFDSWVGCLDASDYQEFVFPHSRKIFDGLNAESKPVIHFGTGTSTILPLMKKAGGSVIGLDWRIPIDEGWAMLGDDVAIQGNLDPAALLGPVDIMESKTSDILERVNNRPGHIFNLGHGILQYTPVENAVRFVDFVHQSSKRA